MADSAAPAAGQGTPAAGVQPAAAGQGGATSQSTAPSNGDGQFNWGLFPDVPEAQRELLQPHLRNIQGHITRMEQQNAPYQPLTQMVQPDQVENLVGFLNGYNADPVATVIGLVQQLQQEGNITAEQLQQLTGQQQVPAAQNGLAQPGQEEQVPQWAQELQQRLAQQDAEREAQAAQQQEAEMAQVMDQAKTNIRAQLTQGGIDESLVTDPMIVAAIIASDGDEQAAANMFSSLRDGFLGAFTNGKTTPGTPPAVQGQLPVTPKPTGRRGDSFGAAKQGAKQFLAQQRQMAEAG